MKTRVFLFAAALIILLAGQAQAADEGPAGARPRTEKDRISYSLGHQIGTDLLRQGLDIDGPALKDGVADGLAGRDPRFPPQEMQTVLAQMKKRILARQRSEKLEMREQRLAAGKKYLEANARREGVVVLPSGLQYEVLRAGSGPRPGPTDRVKVQYEGSFIDGRVIGGSRRKGEPEIFHVNGVIKGLSEALVLMPVGSHWMVYIPPQLGIGNRAELANRTLIYDLELISIEQPR